MVQTRSRSSRAIKSRESSGKDKTSGINLKNEEKNQRSTRSQTTKIQTRSKILLPEKEETILKKKIESNEKSSSALVKRTEFVKLSNYKVDSIVLARQKYSIPWPSRILKIKKDKICVYFFGDKREGLVNSNEIYDFKKSAVAIREVILLGKKPRGYVTGLREIEILLNVPDKESITKTF